MHPNWKCLSTVPIRFKPFVKENKQDIYEQSDAKHISHVVTTSEDVKTIYNEIIAQQHPPISRTKVLIKLKNKVAKPIVNQFKVNAFMCCACKNDVATLKTLLQEYPEKINIVDNFGWSALMCAAQAGSENAVKILLKEGADRAITDKYGNNAISLATKEGHTSIVNKLNADTFITTATVDLSIKEQFFCDSCKSSFQLCTEKEHETSTLHLFNSKQYFHGTHYGIPKNNKGYQLMLKKGWDKETGLGPSGHGVKFPIKTVLRHGRSGFGISQPPARVSHNIEHIEERSSNHVKKRNHIIDYYNNKKMDYKIRLMLS